MDRLIIGIAGKAGSGKSFAAKFIQENFPDLNLEIASFASPLKNFITLLQGEIGDKQDKFALYPNMTIREALQKIGTDALRNNFAKDIWIRALEHRTKGKNIIIDDVRFPNEAKWIHDNGGFIIKINRHRAVLEQIDSHESEQQQLYVDSVVTNEFDDKFGIGLTNAVIDHLDSEIISEKSIVDLVSTWIKEFRVDTSGLEGNIELYTKLLFDEIDELQDEKAGTKEHFHEAMDVIWVAISLALVSGYNPKQIEKGIKILFDSNWSKASTFQDAVKYMVNSQNPCHDETLSGRTMVLTGMGKICKGANYIKPNFDELL